MTKIEWFNKRQPLIVQINLFMKQSSHTPPPLPTDPLSSKLESCASRCHLWTPYSCVWVCPMQVCTRSGRQKVLVPVNAVGNCFIICQWNLSVEIYLLEIKLRSYITIVLVRIDSGFFFKFLKTY